MPKYTVIYFDTFKIKTKFYKIICFMSLENTEKCFIIDY